MLNVSEKEYNFLRAYYSLYYVTIGTVSSYSYVSFIPHREGKHVGYTREIIHGSIQDTLPYSREVW